ncbi:hypothetical protein FEM48_Zijuj06G0188400 [Ziziphus jujuba var. spinosa]|uniref:Protein LIKE COV 2-like n=1 Tax=Ziziphus jujuba var. spinosa TaxID=714518 RepID=A0A978VB08_ZIZJJ|nr:hypothetical protein FEM48_Zijuj06G0188400 [Ziziphus jujuba var. spinosa]
MAEAKESTSIPLSQADPEDEAKSPPSSPNSSTRKGKRERKVVYMELVTTRESFADSTGILACYAVLQSWVSKKFMTGIVVLFPVAVTFFITWWFIQFVDGFFSPMYARLGIDIFGKMLKEVDNHHHLVLCMIKAILILPGIAPSFLLGYSCEDNSQSTFFFFFLVFAGLGFVTSLLFIVLVGIFASSWMGATVFWLGEWFIKKMPFMRHIYSASKQISAAISPGTTSSFNQNTTAFKEVAIIRHPRHGEYAFGFITSSLILQRDDGDEELCSVYVPTNHLYIGDIFLVNSEEVIRPNLSIREGIGLFFFTYVTLIY